MKIDVIAKFIEDVTKRRSETKARLDDLKTQAMKEEAAAQEAAEAGDVETYKKHNAKKADLDAQIYVANVQLEKNLKSEVSKQEAVSAWNEYARGYDTDLKKKLAELEKAKKSLFDCFIEIIDLQDAALRKREQCADFSGVVANDLDVLTGRSDDIYKEFPISTIPLIQGHGVNYHGRIYDLPEVALFSADGMIDEELGKRIHSVTKLHHSY